MVAILTVMGFPSNQTTERYGLPAPSRALISQDVFQEIYYFINFLLLFVLTVFGTTFNLINIAVFLKMGVTSESSNVSLMALAVSDLGSVSSLLLVSSLTFVEHLDIPDLRFSITSVKFIAGGWTHVMFAQMTCWITAFIAVERCVSVVFPFKVKSIFSVKFTIAVSLTIIIYFVLTTIPIFSTQNLQWRFNSQTNTTRLVAVFTPPYLEIQSYFRYINVIISTTLSMLITTACTQITVWRLHTLSAWRVNKATCTDTTSPSESGDAAQTSGKPNALSASVQREQRLAKMIITICVVFIVCNLPGVLVRYVVEVFPEIRFRGAYNNLFYVLYGSSFSVESISSGVNIFIYYRLSTKYRQVLRQWLCLDKKT